MIKLYWCPQTRAIRGLWLLEELGVPYEVVEANVRTGDVPEGFLKASPMGKVPAIDDDGVAVAESAAIALYLADKYTDAGLAIAPDAPERAEYLYWVVYTPGVIEPSMAEKFSGMPANKLAHGWGDYPSMVRVLEERLENREWLMGDTFTAADVLVGSTLNFMRMFGIMPDSKILNAYTDRCVARPAFKRALEKDGAAAAPSA